MKCVLVGFAKICCTVLCAPSVVALTPSNADRYPPDWAWPNFFESSRAPTEISELCGRAICWTADSIVD